MAKKKSVSKSFDLAYDTAQGVGRRRLALSREQVLWACLGTLLVVSSTWYFTTRAPYHDAYTRPSLLSLEGWTCPIEHNAPQRLVRINQHFRDVIAPSGTTDVWAVGESGVILHSDDSGKTWTLQHQYREDATGGVSNSAWPVHAAHFSTDGQFGLAVGFGGVALRCLDGETWTEVAIPGLPRAVLEGTSGEIANALHDVQVIDPMHQWIVGDNVLCYSSDGGDTWTNARIPQLVGEAKSGGYAISAVSANECSVGNQDGIYRTTNGGVNWVETLPTSRIFSLKINGGFGLATGEHWQSAPLPTKGKETVRAAPIDELIPATLVAQRGETIAASQPAQTFWKSTNGGTDWTPISPAVAGVEGPLLAVDVSETGNGWAVGAPGLLLRSMDKLNTWEQVSIPVECTLNAVSFRDEANGWAVGDDGTILHSADSGQTWIRQSQNLATVSAGTYRWFPGIGYYVVLAVSAFVFVRVRNPVSHTEVPTDPIESIDTPGVSDRPLTSDRPDHLNFRPLALAISRFMRNEDTEPPITIAVTGGWGTGKSSLMNLVREDLERHGFRPVWFNAWHHQNEEQMLASLLENIRSNAIPRWRNLGTRLRFRWRLLRKKAGNQIWLVCGFVAIGVLASLIPGLPELIRSSVLWLTSSIKGEQSTLAATESGVGNSGVNLVFWTTLLGVTAAIWRAVTAFGMNPAMLLAQVSNASKIAQLGDKLSFRHRFAEEFKVVTWALKPRALVIMIDDLDRCRPENVLEVLEAINFLVTSGDCYVICGMALNRVEPCIGLGFERVAAEMDSEDSFDGNSDGEGEELDEEENARLRRRQYARQYLEKLINFPIPVPQMTETQARSLVSNGEGLGPSDEEPSPSIRRWAREELEKHSRLLAAAAFLMVVVIMFVISANRRNENTKQTPETTTERSSVAPPPDPEASFTQRHPLPLALGEPR